MREWSCWLLLYTIILVGHPWRQLDEKKLGIRLNLNKIEPRTCLEKSRFAEKAKIDHNWEKINFKRKKLQLKSSLSYYFNIRTLLTHVSFYKDLLCKTCGKYTIGWYLGIRHSLNAQFSTKWPRQILKRGSHFWHQLMLTFYDHFT